MWLWWIGGGVVAIVVGAGLGLWWYLRRSTPAVDWERATTVFRHRREWLEAKFLTLASESGRPRGLVWCDCDFDNDVTFARDRHTQTLQALMAVTIRFDAEVGGGMEDVEAVGRLRAATAVFHYDGENWHTDGRVVFNLTPHETIQHFRHELDPVDLG